MAVWPQALNPLCLKTPRVCWILGKVSCTVSFPKGVREWLPFSACTAAVLLDVSIPHTKTTPRAPKAHFPTRRPCNASAADFPAGGSGGHRFRHKNRVGGQVPSRGRQEAPNGPQRRAKDAQGRQNGAQKLTFGSPGITFGRQFARVAPLRKHYSAGFNHI